MIESMRWASAEETRLKVREIDALRDEVERINASREESLEAQRRYRLADYLTSDIRRF